MPPGKPRRLLSRLTAAPLALVLAAPVDDCEPPTRPPRPQLDSVVKRWWFSELRRGNGGESPLGPDRVQIGGVVNDSLELGSLVLFPPGAGPQATAEVFSNENGLVYWVSAEAPHATPDEPRIGGTAALLQHQTFRKTDRDATLRLVVTRAAVDAIDGNGGLPTEAECPWHEPGTSYQDCRRIMSGWASFRVSAFSFREQTEFFRTGGFVELIGWRGVFDYDAYTDGAAMGRFWDRASFELDPDLGDVGGGRARVDLAQPIVIDVPLATVRVGEIFSLSTLSKASTLNIRQRESYLAAMFRDPVDAEGVEWEYTGLTPLETDPHEPVPPAPAPAPACAGAADPAAGQLELDASDFAHPELGGDGAVIVVRRSGGSKGRVSATVTLSGGSATAGIDYTAVTPLVLFADGEEGTRSVRVPVLTDDVAEPAETLTVSLTDPRGCAALGAQASATLTIQDDDRVVQPATFTVGGTVSGLVGNGLLLREVKSGFDLTPGNGPFTFSYPHPDGSDYEVRIITQPQGPLQVCTVENGSGTIAGANVTDVTVSCRTPAGNGALDQSFGDGGKVTAAAPIAALVVQPDGRIVTVGDKTLARDEPDGRPDLGFGTAGATTVGWLGGTTETVNAVTLQPDGKIVVAGVTRGTGDDFAVARFNPDGTLDASFGAGGKVTTDFMGLTDRAYAVRVDAAGNIVVGGHAARSTPLGFDGDFAVARYTPAGALDPSFGDGGKVMVNIAGRTDLGYGLALQAGGEIVVAGRVADGGGDDPDVGLVRLDATGALDTSFGPGGVVRRGLVPGWDEASDVVVQPDGKILVSVKAVVGAQFELAVARFTATGGLDGSFGGDGFVSTAFSPNGDYASGLAVADDGTIIVVGQASNLSRPDFAVARFLADGSLDASFGTGGKLTVDFFAAADGAEAVAVQPDGKIVVGGAARNGLTVGAGLVRIVP